MNTYTPVIGLEIHVELKTASKMFCGCKNDPFHAPKPNIYTCPVCLGMPGGLPVPNKKAIEWTIMLGLALECDIPLLSKFDRKNYFYPDLPKGYQISQYDQPLCVGGLVKADFGDVRITRVHLEEDTGKLQHTTVDGKKVTLVDFNRSGVPLVEIVTEPDIKSGEHAKRFLKKLHQIVRDLKISDADMEKGSMRLEPNISVRKPGEMGLPAYKVEVKNINSFTFVKRAIEFEINRHTALLEKGQTPAQETRGYIEAKGTTVSQRRKEEAHDYRYFPEPDIPPMRWTKEYVDNLKKQIPQLPEEKRNDLIKVNKLSEYQADILIGDTSKMSLFQGTVSLPSIHQANISGATVANWVINKVVDASGVAPLDLARQITSAKKVVNIDDATIENAIRQVIDANPKAVADFKLGKEQSLMFLFGQTLKELKVNTDKQKVLDMLRDVLKR